jgi:hypothetical protein
LGKKKNKKKKKKSGKKGRGDDKYSGFMGATVMINHASGDGAGWDESVVDQAFIDAYNAVHNNGYEITSAFIDKEVDIPEDETGGDGDDGEPDHVLTGAVVKKNKSYWPYYGVVYYYAFGYECRLCGNDDFLTSFTQVLVESQKADRNVHKDFEEHFCQSLRESAIVSFKDAKHCSIEFTYSPDVEEEADAATIATLDTVARKKKHQPAPSPTKQEMTGQMEITHVFNGATVSDIAALGQSFIEAYNEVHEGTGYMLTSFNLQREVDVPEDEGGDDTAQVALYDTALAATGSRSNKSKKYRYYSQLLWYAFTSECHLCGDDADADAKLPGFDEMLLTRSSTGERLHGAFEELFCHKLKMSGLDKYFAANKCSIVFSYSTAANIDKNQETASIAEQ